MLPDVIRIYNFAATISKNSTAKLFSNYWAVTLNLKTVFNFSGLTFRKSDK